MASTLTIGSAGRFADHSRWVRLALGLAVFFAVLAMFSRIMGEDLRHDEHLFIAASVLFADNTPYLDFVYNHLPNLPILLGTIYEILGTDHYLLIGRLVVFAFWVAFAIGVYLLAARLSDSRAFGLFAVTMLLTNSLMISHVTLVVSNSIFPAALLVFGFYAFVVAMDDQHDIATGWMVASGFLLALAAGFKANFAVFIPAFVLAALLLPRHLTTTERLSTTILPLAIGGIIGALPTLYFLLLHTDVLFFNVFDFFVGPHRAYWSEPANAATVTGLTLSSRLVYGYLLWLGGTTSLIVLTIVYFGLIGLLDDARSFLAGCSRSWPFLLSLLLVPLGVFVSFAVAPSFPQYFLPPIPVALALAASVFGLLRPDQQKAGLPFMAALVAVALLINGPRLIVELPKLANPVQWTGSKVHAVAEALGERIREHDLEGPIGTLTPIYALEAGFDIHPELEGTSFYYRLGEHLPSDERVRHNIATPGSIDQAFDHVPPAAILVGFEDELDGPLIDYALGHGYVRQGEPFGKDRYGVGTLYLRPPAEGR